MSDRPGKKIYGLLGWPVKHSFSPAMHNAAFKSLGIDAEYRLFETPPDQLDSFLKNLNKNIIKGLNVTVPYKESVLGMVELDKESFYLREIKAVNTIAKKDNVWHGFNTDIPGFERHLKENIDPKGKRAAVLGAGGGARAVVYVLAKSGAKDIAIFDIDRSKAENIQAMIKSILKFDLSIAKNVEDLDIKNRDLLINATPIGLKETDPSLIKSEHLHKRLFVYDLVYNPAKTKLLKEAESLGLKCSNGLGMLLYQGALSFKHWTGKNAPIDVMRRALEREMAKT